MQGVYGQRQLGFNHKRDAQEKQSQQKWDFPHIPCPIIQIMSVMKHYMRVKRDAKIVFFNCLDTSWQHLYS